MLIDSHCHLGFKDYPDSEIEAVLERAAKADVALMVNVGAGEGFDGNLVALKIAKKYPQVFCTVGLHPHDARIVTPAMLLQLEELARDPRVVAIGEMGLDFHYEHSPRDIQEKVLESQIELAKKIGKPIMIHDRDAGDRTHDILKNQGVTDSQVMIHCFTGDTALARQYLDLGCLLSFTGIITFKKSESLRAVVKMTPVERMLVETDSPYLAPEPYRGKRNEPAFVSEVARRVAQIKDLSFEDIARVTTLNATRFFKLPLPAPETQIAYAIRNSLYLNITNRCTLACTFCPKFIDYEVKGYYLKLKKEPTVDEVLAAAGDVSQYDEVVFCGYGEPTRCLDALLEIGKRLKEKYPSKKIRLNTDGLGNLVHGRNIIPELAQVIDSVSVSLNAQDAQTYVKYCPSKYKEAAYPAVKDFIRDAVGKIADVQATAVGAGDVDDNACRQIVEALGARWRFRELDNVG